MRSITCLCEHVFDADLPEIIDLDLNPEILDEIAKGSFFSAVCPSCGKIIKPELPVKVIWPSHDLELHVEPEQDRADFYLREADLTKPIDIVIGYPELADRLAVIAAGLKPIVIEALKYFLLIKAEEAVPDAEVSAWFSGVYGDNIEFHLHGLRAEEIAVSRIPMKLYENTKNEYLSSPRSEPYSSLQWGPYLSVQNLFRRIR